MALSTRDRRRSLSPPDDISVYVDGDEGTAAHALEPLLTEVLGPRLPVRIELWDGSTIGPVPAPGVLRVRSRDALRRLLWAPDELGLSRAYVAGDLDLDGDIFETLERLRDAVALDGPPRASGSRRGPSRLPAPRGVRPAPPAATRGGPTQGAPPLAAARRSRRPSPLRRRERLLRARARTVDDLLVRAVLRSGDDARGRAGVQARARSHESSGLAEHPGHACWTSGAAGDRWRSTPPCTTAHLWSASPSAGSRPSAPASAWRRQGSATSSRSESRTTATSTTRALRRHLVDRDVRARGREPHGRVLRVAPPGASPRGPAPQPRHLEGGSVAPPPTVLQRSLRVPGRRAHRRRTGRPGHGVGGLRGARRGVACASTTPARSAPGSPTSRRAGTPRSPSSASARARIWRLYMAGVGPRLRGRRLSVHQVLGVTPTASGASGMPPTRDGWQTAG